MSKFIKKIFIFLSLFLLSLALVIGFDITFIKNQYLGSYQASLLDKVERLKAIQEPKIVLIGNSNVNFGVDSKEIERSLKMPVVDMGLHGGLGNSFHENMVRYGISKGDIIVIMHSNYADNDTIPDSVLALSTLEKHFHLWKVLRVKDVFSLVKAYPEYMFKALKLYLEGSPGNVSSKESSYSREAFNEYGDIVKRYEGKYTFKEGSVPVPQITESTIRRLNHLNRYIRERGGTMLVAGYPIGQGEFTPPAEVFENFEKDLRENLDCEVISKFTDYFIPYECFYDTYLHLNDEGVKLRTAQLIEDLLAWMKK